MSDDVDELLDAFDAAEKRWKAIENDSVAHAALKVAWPGLKQLVAVLIPAALASIPGGALGESLALALWKFVTEYVDRKLGVTS